jgi:hypothetical protein
MPAGSSHAAFVAPGPKYKPPSVSAGPGMTPLGGSGVPGMPPGMPSFPGMPGTGGGFGAGLPNPPTPGAPGSPGGMPGTGGGFGAAPPGLPGAPGGPMTNNVTPSADIKELQDLYRKRLTNDPTQRAIQRSSSAIRDNTSGLMKEMGSNFAARGMGQAGARKNAAGGLAADAQQQIARASSDISLGRERDLDALTMGGLPIMGAQDELGLRKQGLGIQQWTAQNQAELARQQLGLQAQNQAQQGQLAMMDMWTKYLNMFR